MMQPALWTHFYVSKDNLIAMTMVTAERHVGLSLGHLVITDIEFGKALCLWNRMTNKSVTDYIYS